MIEAVGLVCAKVDAFIRFVEDRARWLEQQRLGRRSDGVRRAVDDRPAIGAEDKNLLRHRVEGEKPAGIRIETLQHLPAHPIDDHNLPLVSRDVDFVISRVNNNPEGPGFVSQRPDWENNIGAAPGELGVRRAVNDAQDIRI